MHLVATYVRPSLLIAATAKEPIGPGFSAEEVAAADKMKVYGTCAKDPGPDFCVFHLLKDEKELCRKLVNDS